MIYYMIWAVWIGLTFTLYYFHRKMNKEPHPPGPPGSIEYIRYNASKFYDEDSIDEATKRIDPKMNVLADEPKTAKSVRPTQVKKSEREISENREVR